MYYNHADHMVTQVRPRLLGVGDGDRLVQLLERDVSVVLASVGYQLVWQVRGDGGHGAPLPQQPPLRLRHLLPEQSPAPNLTHTQVSHHC